MDTTVPQSIDVEAEAEARLPQPRNSKLSIVLNGMGNGAMIGGATYVMPKVLAILRDKPLPTNNVKGSIFATILGTTLGTWYGLREARQLEIYRDNIATEIVTLRDRVHTLESKEHQSHAEKITANRAVNDNETMPMPATAAAKTEAENDNETHAEKVAASRDQADEVSR